MQNIHDLTIDGLKNELERLKSEQARVEALIEELNSSFLSIGDVCVGVNCSYCALDKFCEADRRRKSKAEWTSIIDSFQKGLDCMRENLKDV